MGSAVLTYNQPILSFANLCGFISMCRLDPISTSIVHTIFFIFYLLSFYLLSQGGFCSPTRSSQPHFHLHHPRQFSTLPSTHLTTPLLLLLLFEQMLFPPLAHLQLPTRVLDSWAVPNPLSQCFWHLLFLFQLDPSASDWHTCHWDSGIRSNSKCEARPKLSSKLDNPCF